MNQRREQAETTADSEGKTIMNHAEFTWQLAQLISQARDEGSGPDEIRSWIDGYTKDRQWDGQ